METYKLATENQVTEKCCAINNSEIIKKEKRQHAGLWASIAIVLPALLLLYHYLPGLVDYMTFDLIQLNPESHLGEAINFFIFSTSTK